MSRLGHSTSSKPFYQRCRCFPNDFRSEGVQRPQGLFYFPFARVHAGQSHSVVRIVPRELQNFQVFFFRFEQMPGPAQNPSTPRTRMHVLRSHSGLAVNNPYCRNPILRFGIFPHFCLPLRPLRLRTHWYSQ